jgi:hypothetical protein
MFVIAAALGIVTAIALGSVPPSGGTMTITISGIDCAPPSCKATGWIDATFQVIDVAVSAPNVLVLNLPPHDRGPVPVTLALSTGNAVSLTAHYAILADYERLLIPVVANDVPGAFGSRWTTVTSVVNEGLNFAPLDVPACERPEVTDPCFGIAPLRPFGSTKLTPFTPAGSAGVFIGVLRWVLPDVTLHSRLQDTSRQAQTWGTEQPAVRESSFVSHVTLVDIPTDARFRVQLRTYGSDEKAAPVRIRVYAMSGSEAFADVVRTLNPAPRNSWPAYDQVAFLDLVPQFTASETLRLRIDALDASQKLWAFASVTNNETQHVTLITPQ